MSTCQHQPLEYMRVAPTGKDAMDQDHAIVYARCRDCGAEYQAGMIHLPAQAPAIPTCKECGTVECDEGINAQGLCFDCVYGSKAPAIQAPEPAIVQEIEYARDHGWPFECRGRLEAMAAAWKRRAALATPSAAVSAEPWAVSSWRCKSPVGGFSFVYEDVPERVEKLRANGWTCEPQYMPVDAPAPAPTQPQQGTTQGEE